MVARSREPTRRFMYTFTSGIQRPSRRPRLRVRSAPAGPLTAAMAPSPDAGTVVMSPPAARCPRMAAADPTRQRRRDARSASAPSGRSSTVPSEVRGGCRGSVNTK